MYVKSPGLVLKETNIKEADKLLTILTRDNGKLTVKAPGARRKGCRFRSSAQLFAYSEFTLFEYKGYYSINEAEPIEHFMELSGELELLSLASYFLQLLDAASDEDSVNNELLSLGLNSLYALSKLKKSPDVVKPAFELRLICLAGYEPQVFECPYCGNEQPDRFNLTEGTVHCAACRGFITEGISMPINPAALSAVRHIVSGDPRKIFSYKIDAEAEKQLIGVSEAYVLTQLERSFSTLDFYKTII